MVLNRCIKVIMVLNLCENVAYLQLLNCTVENSVFIVASDIQLHWLMSEVTTFDFLWKVKIKVSGGLLTCVSEEMHQNIPIAPCRSAACAFRKEFQLLSGILSHLSAADNWFCPLPLLVSIRWPVSRLFIDAFRHLRLNLSLLSWGPNIPRIFREIKCP